MLMSAFFDEIINNLSKWNVILGLALAVIGLILTFTAYPIAKLFSKNKEIKKESGEVFIVKIVGMALCIAGLCFTIFL